MGLTGLIFGAIAAAWLVYLVPYLLNRRVGPESASEDPAEPFSATVTIVRRGSDLATAEEGNAIVSTPLTRRAQLHELNQIDREAASRRRRVLAALLIVFTVSAVLAAFGLSPWWYAAIPFGLIAVFLVIARFTVRAMRRELDRRAARIRAGFDEETVAIKVVDPEVADTHVVTVELTAPVVGAGSLWEPIPITKPTYVSTPLAPRTVRTIDLSAPVPKPRTSVPVTAEVPDSEAAPAEIVELPKVVGE